MNIIVVNYQDLVPHFGIPNTKGDFLGINRDLGYLESFDHVPKIGKQLSYFLRDFVKACQCDDRIHIIGFSLGAHVAHYMAQGPISLSRKIARITGKIHFINDDDYNFKSNDNVLGLEPAAPFYEYNLVQPHLTKNDAKFVDIVHTDAGAFQYGWTHSLGHVDFWANGGHPVQPPCGTDKSGNEK